MRLLSACCWQRSTARSGSVRSWRLAISRWRWRRSCCWPCGARRPGWSCCSARSPPRRWRRSEREIDCVARSARPRMAGRLSPRGRVPMLRLYPAPPQELPVAGAYLAQRLHTQGSPARPFVYADFVMSLDGRIALGESAARTGALPEALPNASDLRLMLELIAQADCLITHGGYLRAVAEGRLEDIMQVGLRRGQEDLAAWRRAEGLAAQPAILVASASLDFPLPPSLAAHGQRVIIATGAASPPAKREAWRGRGYEVIVAGRGAAVE